MAIVRPATHVACAVVSLSFVALVATPQAAAKKPKEPDEFTAFEEELLQTSGFDDADETALKQMRRCRGFDDKWQRQLDDPSNYSLNDTLTVVRISVVCWEKVGKKHATGHPGVDAWVGAWHGFLGGTAMWLEAQIARLEVDRDRFCSRIDSSLETLEAAVTEAEALPSMFSTAPAQELATGPFRSATQVQLQARDLRETVGCL
ncbi:MAG: hypothetical protein QGH45_19765 [Myxococcota bacterium]|jgi:hypothetical protein|nr:hypothetical protein [Myxococcota bacterium]